MRLKPAICWSKIEMQMKQFIFAIALALSFGLGGLPAQAQVVANDASAIDNGVLVVRATV